MMMNRTSLVSAALAALVAVGCGDQKMTVEISPTTANVTAGATQQFTATVKNASNTEVTWSVKEQNGGTITAAGEYTAPATAGDYTVVATSKADTTVSATAAVKVTAVTSQVQITLSPPTATIGAGATQQFTATVTGTTNTGVNWSVKEAGGGTISDTGLYTAPAEGGTYTVVANSQADTTRSAEAQVTVDPTLVSIAISPTTATINSDQTQPFSVVVNGTTDKTVTWAVQEQGGGTVVAENATSALYTPPATSGVYRVVVTSQADTTKTAVATVTVTAVSQTIAVMVSPATADVEVLKTQQFTATVTGTSDTSVTWSVRETDCGTVDATGLYTAPATVPGSVCNVDAVSVADGTRKGSAVVTVKAAPPAGTISLSPTTATVLPNATRSFTATLSNLTPNTVTWSILEANGGTIVPGSTTRTATYTAPNSAGTFTVVATSDADPTKSASAVITVPAVTVNPDGQTVMTGDQLKFLAVVAGGAAVNWSVPAAAGTISSTGLFTAGSTPGTYTVRAEVASDATVFDEVTVEVTQKPAQLLSGTVSYAGAKTGWIQIVALNQDSDIVGGTSLKLPTGMTSAPFTIRGLPVGNFYLYAWMDTTGSGGFNRPSEPFFVSSAPHPVGTTAIAVTLADPTPDPLTAPEYVDVWNGDGVVTVEVGPSLDGNNDEIADEYRVTYVNAMNTADTGTVTVPAGYPALAVLSGLSGTYNISAVGLRAGVAGPATTRANFVVTAPPTAAGSITGTAEFTGSTTAPGALYAIALLRSSPWTIYATRIATPAANQAFTISNVAAGSYYVLIGYDVSGDGALQATEPQQILTATVASAAVTVNPTATRWGSAVNAASTTRRVGESAIAAPSVVLDFNVSASAKIPAKVTISGPNIADPIDLPRTGRGEMSHVLTLAAGAVPATGDAYTANITYTDDTTATVPLTLAGAFAGAPAVSSPKENEKNVSVTPTFTWTAPTGATPTTWKYTVYVLDYAADELVWTTVVPSTDTSVAFTPLGTLTQLDPNSAYLWWVVASDAEGNAAVAGDAFFVTAP